MWLYRFKHKILVRLDQFRSSSRSSRCSLLARKFKKSRKWSSKKNKNREIEAVPPFGAGKICFRSEIAQWLSSS